ncbi:nitroreductase [Saccharopolyspora gloriosae]|uniref:nitroreductase n=1 Tax=Saccharopolyspora gloriosae TaxID=455344 RepID=UPI001FB7D593|nr:nitroreductase [Saccharopolyspora gloriosae]
MTTPAAHFSEIAKSRHSVRRFKSTPLAPQDIRGVLEDAQTAPSNCNTQPWTVHVASGSARDQLSKELIKADEEGRHSSDFTFDYADFGEGTYLERAHEHAATLYGSLGIERADKAGRRGVILDNLAFYGAPHVAFLFMPQFGDGVRAAGDIGMYAQNFLLSLTARGLGGIPQTALGSYADTIRDFLGVPQELKLLFGIAFGHSDEAAPGNSFRMSRVSLHDSVVLHETPGVLDEQ